MPKTAGTLTVSLVKQPAARKLLLTPIVPPELAYHPHGRQHHFGAALNTRRSNPMWAEYALRFGFHLMPATTESPNFTARLG
jgi:hypothetical protein